MRFLTPSECEAWLASAPPAGTAHPLSIQLPRECGRLLFIALNVADKITCRQRCLLRVENWDVWQNSNWNLYYRLRQSYGDHRLIDEAPGHLFVEHETEDLATFLHLAMLFGWDADLRPLAPYASGQLSHDGFLDLYSSTDAPDQLSDLRKIMESANLVSSPQQ